MPQLKPKLTLLSRLMAALALFVILFPGACLARPRSEYCGSVFCGNVNISSPFRLKNQPLQCGVHKFELECENNNRTTFVSRQGKFSVKEILYENYTMRVVDAGLDMDDCNSLPLSSIDIFSSAVYLVSTSNYKYITFLKEQVMFVVNCTELIESSVYVEASRCTTKSNTSSHSTSYFYFFSGNMSDFNPSCNVEAQIPIVIGSIENFSTQAIYEKLSEGFLVSWESNHLATRYVAYGINQGIPIVVSIIIVLRASPGIICLVVAVIYKWRRRHLSMDDRIEEFLQSHHLAPIRYSFKEIKTMSHNFRDKLGEGGFGSVFKGKLRSGHYVAIKLLKMSKSGGQDFINEVASIGRIHHANVVKLVGFCVEGSKQALVYDFMSNGSLDKIIFTEEKNNTLGWKKMFEIVLGVARGIDYLHRGCDMQILHFDIKPHNILLDENFNPKVSDFGLAKLYSTDDSIVSLTAARGTIGYIAPELVYKNLGGFSYKADVYSFGMLLMEMVGRRKNVNAFADHTSQIYFPSWIYNRLDQGEDMELLDASDDEKVMVRKMIITAFWCIQLQPADRLSMSQVLKMLESDVELLEMPPKPFHQLPLDTSSEVHGRERTDDEASTSEDAITITSSNIV